MLISRISTKKMTTIADPFIGEVVEGIESAANEYGYSVILANSKADPELELKVVDGFCQRRVDGILVTASRVGATNPGCSAFAMDS